MKSWSRQQFEEEQTANPRAKRNKPSGEFRNIPAGSEDERQAQFFKWIDLHKGRFPVLAMFYAIPNGGHLTKFGRYVGSITGRRSGVPDTHLPCRAEDGSGAIGLWIEFKSSTGSTSPEQKIWLRDLQAVGHKTMVLRTWTDAANATISYLNLPLPPL